MNLSLKFLVYLSLLCSSSLFAQNAPDNATILTGENYAVAFYKTVINKQSHLYNGREEVIYRFPMVGQPYYDNEDWKYGSVTYDGYVYENVPLKFNLVTQELIVQHFDGFYKIQLIKGKVTDFSIAGHKFISINTSEIKAKPAFEYYELLSDGNTKFLAKRKKVIDEVYTSSSMQREISEKLEYFIYKGNSFFKVNSKSSVLKVFEDDKVEIQKFMSANKIRFNANRVSATVKITEYYNATHK